MLPVTNEIISCLVNRRSDDRLPGHSNTVSVRTLPPSYSHNCVPMIVMIGIKAFLERMRHNDCFSEIPFALAVLKYSCFRTSNIDDLVVLVSVAIRPVPIVTAGSTIDDSV